MLHVELTGLWCWKFDTSESRSEIHGKFWNVVLEKGRKKSVGRIVWEM